MRRPYLLRLPPGEPDTHAQDRAWFTLELPGAGAERIRFHDYGAIFRRPGLYEQLFYDRLKCRSPHVVGDILERVVRAADGQLSRLRVLDLGAGNGMLGEVLARKGVARLVGVDIEPEARAACDRDRPGVYDGYYVTDLTTLEGVTAEELSEWHINCLTTVAALGFGDIPPAAFRVGYNLVADGGWVAFNIKETFLAGRDRSGFAMLVKQLMLEDALEIHHLERYVHRISIDGAPLYYHALVGRKKRPIPADWLT